MPKLTIKVSDFALQADKSALKKVLREAGKEIAAEARRLINGSTGGAGNPPQNKTGNLAKSITLKVKNNGLTVTDDAFYALALEAGGKASTKRQGRSKRGINVSNWKLEPRPFLSTAIENVENDNLSQRIGDAIVNGISLKETKGGK